MNTVIITGATSCAGLAVSAALIRQGYRVVGVGRTKESCEAAREKLLLEAPGADICFYCGDMMQQREVHRLADELSAHLMRHCEGRLHALINLAGCRRNWYTTTEEGYEQQFSLNHLAGFLLTYRLFPFLKKGNGRVVLTSENPGGTVKMNWMDIMYKKKYKPLAAFRQSRLCGMLFAYAFNIRFAKDGVRACVVPAETAAKDALELCGRESTAKGLYDVLCLRRKYGSAVCRADAERLFSLSERLCDIEYGVYAT
jgi:NAD(P)-dependent dehydrogenase (short-subunit alcohol dehydrogenase family)